MKTKGRLSILLIVTLLLIFPTVSAFATDFTETFTDLNAKILAANFNSGIDITFDILNLTGVTWTDFHMQVGLGGAGTQGLAMFGLTGTPYEGPGTYSLSSLNNPPQYPDVLDIIGLNILNGSTFSFSLDIAAGESGWVLAGYPTVDSQPPGQLPEPGTLLLLGSGLLGLVGLGRRVKK